MNLQTSGAIVRLGLWVRRTLITLADLIVPSHLAVFERVIGISHTMLIGIAAELRLADRVAEERKTVETLARELNVSFDILERCVNALVARGFFRYRADRTLANTRLSNTLRAGRNEATADWARYFASHSNASSWLDLPNSLRGDGSPFERMHGMNVWEWFAQHKNEEETFALSMMGVTRIHAPVILSLYSFADYKLICDIGGGRGTLLSFILAKHPRLNAILYDAPGVLDSARQLFEEKRIEKNRIQLIAGNFFENIPPDAECYLLKNILHDWNDQSSLRLLARFREQMKPGQTILLIEQFLSESKPDLLQTFSDIQMHVACSDGRERSQKHFESLLRQAGFRVTMVKAHPLLGLIEAVPV